MLVTGGLGVAGVCALTPILGSMAPILSAGAFAPELGRTIAKTSLVSGALSTAAYGASTGAAAQEIDIITHDNHAFESDFIM